LLNHPHIAAIYGIEEGSPDTKVNVILNWPRELAHIVRGAQQAGVLDF
jgi:hypothetical protein